MQIFFVIHMIHEFNIYQSADHDLHIYNHDCQSLKFHDIIQGNVTQIRFVSSQQDLFLFSMQITFCGVLWIQKINYGSKNRTKNCILESMKIISSRKLNTPQLIHMPQSEINCKCFLNLKSRGTHGHDTIHVSIIHLEFD